MHQKLESGEYSVDLQVQYKMDGTVDVTVITLSGHTPAVRSSYVPMNSVIAAAWLLDLAKLLENLQEKSDWQRSSEHYRIH